MKRRKHTKKKNSIMARASASASIWSALLLITLAEGGVVTTLAGSGAIGLGDGLTATAQFNYPYDVAVTQDGSVVVADTSNRLIRLVANGVVTTPAAWSWLSLSSPYGVGLMRDGNVVVADSGNNRIRVVVGGTVTTLGSGRSGFADGSATTAMFNRPSGFDIMRNGSIVVADTFNYRIRLVASDGTVTTLAGSGTKGFADGSATTARFNDPSDVAVTQNGSFVVADSGNNRIRLVASDGTVTTLAGSGTSGFADGSAATAQFTSPFSVAVMQSGSIVVADSGNNRIRLVFLDGDGKTAVMTIAGSGINGFANAPALDAQFSNPSGLGLMQNGNVVVADSNNHRIRLVADIASTLCTTEASCNNHATSVSGTFSSCACTCSTGYTGAACGSCAAHYAGYPACTPIVCTSADCNGHESAVSGTPESGCTCTCSTGYSGSTCSSCATYYGGYPTCTLSLTTVSVFAYVAFGVGLLSLLLSGGVLYVVMRLRAAAQPAPSCCEAVPSENSSAPPSKQAPPLVPPNPLSP